MTTTQTPEPINAALAKRQAEAHAYYPPIAAPFVCSWCGADRDAPCHKDA